MKAKQAVRKGEEQNVCNKITRRALELYSAIQVIE
jgi:hypothetical protein